MHKCFLKHFRKIGKIFSIQSLRKEFEITAAYEQNFLLVQFNVQRFHEIVEMKKDTFNLVKNM